MCLHISIIRELLKISKCRPHHRPIKSQSPGVGHRSPCILKFPRWFPCADEFRNHHSGRKSELAVTVPTWMTREISSCSTSGPTKWSQGVTARSCERAGPGAELVPWFFHSLLVSMFIWQVLILLLLSESLSTWIVTQGTSIMSGPLKCLADCEWLSFQHNPALSSRQI